MSFIPTVFLPFEDELLYSWVIRLAKANGLTTFSFANLYGGRTYNKNLHWSYDMKLFFVKICEHIRAPLDVKELFLKHSTFNFDGILMTDHQQTKYINNCFRPKSPLNANMNSLIRDIKYCPMCAQEEDTPFLHISHNLNGVCVCTKHHCRLKVFKGIWGHEMEFNPNDYDDVECKTDAKNALIYAHYVNALNKVNLKFNIKDVRDVVYDRLHELGYTLKDSYGPMMRDVAAWPCAALFDFDLYDFLKNKMTLAQYITYDELIPLLMFLFPSPQDFLSCFAKEKDILREYTCRKCGHKYITTIHSKKIGWGCPECDSKLTAHQLFKRLVSAIDNGEYVVKGDFVSLSQEVEIYHNKCNESFYVKPNRFLFDGVRCPCERKTTMSQAKSMVEKSGEFHLINFTTAYDFITVLHKKCGTIQQCRYDHFIHNQRCQVCHSAQGSNITTELFAAKVKNLTGEEYSVVSEFINQDTTITIKHNVCGLEHDYYPRHFLDGHRCPRCHKFMRIDDVDNLLKEYGNGRYVITDSRNGFCVVWDNEKNISINLSPLKIRQEILRPTMSDILPIPYDKKQTLKLNVITPWDIGFEHLLRYKEEFGHTRVKKREKYCDYHLGTWCQHQRDEYRKGNLSPDRYQRLSKIGFSFDRLVDEWTRKYEQYKLYIQLTGIKNIARRTEFKGEKLGSWVHKQKRVYKEGKLSQERINKLLLLNPTIFGAE